MQRELTFTDPKPETDCERVVRLLEGAGDYGVDAQNLELGKGFRLASRVRDLRKKHHYVIDGYDRRNQLSVYRLIAYPDGRWVRSANRPSTSFERMFSLTQHWRPRMANPHEPSEAPPGTSQKLDLLARRAELGLELFNSEDAVETTEVGKWEHLGRGSTGRYETRDYPELHYVDDDDE